VIDALSNACGYPTHSFAALSDPSCFGLKLSKAQLTNLKDWYRNFLAHNGMIAPGTVLTPETEGDAIEFSTMGQQTKIRIPQFYRIIEKAWKEFDKARLEPEKYLKPKHGIKISAEFTALATVPFVASGTYIPETKKK
jgi:hypothetical protein